MSRDESNEQPKRRPPTKNRKFIPEPELTAEQAAISAANQRKLKEDFYRRQRKRRQ